MYISGYSNHTKNKFVSGSVFKVVSLIFKFFFCQKPPAAPPAKPAVTKAAARSRLAAVKAAMKAKQQAAEAEKATQEAANTENQTHQEPQPQAEEEVVQTLETVVFDGGFFKVESPAKSSGESNGFNLTLSPQLLVEQ